MSANLSPNVKANGNLPKHSINLLQAELLPKKVLLTLPRVVIVWSLAFLMMLSWAIVVHFTQQSIKAELAVVKQENQVKTNQLDALTAELTARKVDSLLADRLTTLKLLMSNKQALHAKLTNPNKTYVTGFAVAMDELAQMHHQDIRLETININNDDMTFTGLAISPEAVPAWLARFEHSSLLSGKSFSHFKLSENEQNITEFMVSSKVKSGATNE